MKRAICLMITLLCLLPVVSSCGISEEEHNSVVTELEEARLELQELEEQLETADEKLDQTSLRIEVINGLFVPIMKGDVPDTSYFFQWRDKIVTVGDPVLTDMFNEMMDEQSDEKLTEFFVYLFESTAEALR